MATKIEIIVPRRGVNDEGKGKKYALGKLIGAATAEYVWLQDDDIVPPTASEEDVLRAIGDADLLILPLRMETESGRQPNLIERLQMAEYAAIQQLTIDSARRGHAVLCSGANLVVKRTAWLAAKNELHPEIPSGDDMFLLEALKRRGGKIRTVSEQLTPTEQERLTAIVRPIRDGKALVRQRMRWAGKAPAYTDRDIRICGTVVAAANIAQLLCPLVVLLKFPIDFWLIRKREPRTSLGVAILLALLYPYYMLVCIVGGIVRTKRGQGGKW